MTGRRRLPKWGGRRAQAWSAAVLREQGRVCALRLEGCTVVATTADHVKPRSTHPHLQYDPRNGRPACSHCNSKRGARVVRTVDLVDETGWFA